LVKTEKLKSHYLILALLGCFTHGCGLKQSDKQHLHTNSISEELHAETYRVSSYGVAGDVYKVFLTDSVQFRADVMTYYDNDFIEIEQQGDNIHVKRKTEKRTPQSSPQKILVEEAHYSLLDLKTNNTY